MNSKQAQLKAKQRRDLAKKAKLQEQAFSDSRLRWAKFGLFNTRNENEALLNSFRLDKNLPILPIGNHWCFWTHRGRHFANYNTERIVEDTFGIVRLEYSSDRITFSQHTCQQIYVRANTSLERAYKPNAGLDGECLAQYLRRTYGNFQKVLDCEVAFRTDIVVPFLGGALLGNVRYNTNDFVVHRVGNKYVTKFQKPRLIFRAETWISNDLMRPNQREVCEALLGGRADEAADIMLAMEAYNFEEVDMEQQEQIMEESKAMTSIINKLI